LYGEPCCLELVGIRIETERAVQKCLCNRIMSVGNHVYFNALRGLAPTGGTTLYILSIAPFIALQSSLLQPFDKLSEEVQEACSGGISTFKLLK
jgi:hypothetical protein